MPIKIKKLQQVFLYSSLCSLSFIEASAQDYVDLAKFHYANTPLNTFEDTLQGTRVEEIGLDLTAPVPLNEDYTFITGMYLEKISTQAAPATNTHVSVYTTNLKLGVNIRHSEKWSGTYLLLPKLSSDFKNISGNDFQIGALGLLKFMKNDHLNYKMGLYYNSELFGPFFVPILGLYYQSQNRRFEADFSLPLVADANYALQDWLHAGLNFNAFVRSYYLNEPQFAENDEYLVKTTNEIFAYLQFSVWKNLLVQTKLGYSIGRNYRIYDVSDKITFGLTAFKFGDDREQLNTDFKDGAIFSVKVLYRFFIVK